ncbi:helix-turn-helix domain-containing protein [Leptospira bandrabouensis]|uniref:Helix-turn-helix domain-containing protein n=1 Tax=Leptospira bandrabouensis TaxID=2484903 RepID=A0A6H3NMS3_9LEPT|nr:helix-turn-helix domain-containing protein [Leptospira bandrabouensis]TGN11594.1 helix-turn-helix domain-containing protein [Leptospira bandrabouensis]
MKAQSRTGVWTPVWIEKLKLSHSQTRLLAEIVSLHEKDGCFASNKYLSEILGLKTDTVSRLISDLKKMGLLVQTGFDGRRRYLKPIYAIPMEKQASEKNPIQKVSAGKEIQPTPMKKSNADSDFVSVPITTNEVHNKIQKRDTYTKDGKNRTWERFIEWSRGKVSNTTWTMIQNSSNPSQLSGVASVYWNRWQSA